jgi:MFS family permease
LPSDINFKTSLSRAIIPFYYNEKGRLFKLLVLVLPRLSGFCYYHIVNNKTFSILLACFLTVLAAYSIRYSYGTLLPEMLPALDITKTEAGVIYSSYFVAYTVLSPVLGLMADRFNLRVLISVFVALMGAGAFLMQYSHSVTQATVFFTIAGIGCAACWAPVMALAQRWISDKRRGFSLAMIDAGSALGVIVAGALVPLAVVNSGWKLGWTCLGIMGIVLGLVNYLLIRDYPQAPVQKTSADLQQSDKVKLNYKQVLRDRYFWLIGIAYLLTGFAIIIPFTFLSTYAVQELGFPYNSAAILITIIGVGGIVGKITLGPLSDKAGRVRIMILCAFLIGAGCLSMVFCQGWLLMAVCFIYGIGYGACWALYAACASDFFSKKTVGGIIGLWTFLMGIGSIIAPIISGWSADRSGTLMWAFIMAMAAGFISLLLLLAMLKSRRISQQAS